MKREKPYAVVMTPPTGAMQGDSDNADRDMLQFCLAIARLQCAAGRHFILVLPQRAATGHHPELDELMLTKGVYSTDLHMCAYGLRSKDARGEGTVYRPTKLVTSMEVVALGMQRKCRGCQRHVHGCAPAAEHPRSSCQQLTRTMDLQWRRDHTDTSRNRAC